MRLLRFYAIINFTGNATEREKLQMSRKVKIWLIIAVCFVVSGMIFAGVMSMLEWDFAKLLISNYETNTCEITKSYTDISISTSTAHIEFLPSEDEKTRVICKEYKNEKHIIGVIDGALNVKINNTKKWYEYIGINFGSPKITVYLPKNEYGALNIKGSTGNVRISEALKFSSVDVDISTGDILLENVKAEAVNLNVSTGKTTVANINCKILASNGSTGSVTLKNVIAEDKLSIKRSTGNIKLQKCDGGEISIKNGTGDIKGSFLSDKVFIASASTGRVDVPKTTSGGRCEITTSTGDIKITVE